MFIFIQVKPIIVPLDVKIVANIEEDYELVCEVERANPLPTITWESQLENCDFRSKCKPNENGWEQESKVGEDLI